MIIASFDLERAENYLFCRRTSPAASSGEERRETLEEVGIAEMMMLYFNGQAVRTHPLHFSAQLSRGGYLTLSLLHHIPRARANPGHARPVQARIPWTTSTRSTRFRKKCAPPNLPATAFLMEFLLSGYLFLPPGLLRLWNATIPHREDDSMRE